MPDHHRIVREVSWHDLFPWLLLLRTCRLAAELRRLVLAALGVVLTGVGWWAIDQDDFVATPPEAVQAVDGETTSLLYVPWRETSRAFVANWRFATRPARQLFTRPFSLHRFLASLAAAMWALVVWAFVGGVICRISAVQLAIDEQLTLASAVRFVLRRPGAYLAAPLMPLGMAMFFALPLVIAGLLAQADLGILVSAVGWPLALIGAVLSMLLMVGVLLGFPLLWSAIGVDGSDSFDAVSRTYTYVGQRPLNYLFYSLVSLGIGTVGWLIINTLAALTIYLASWAASVGSGEERWQQIEHTPAWGISIDKGFLPLLAPTQVATPLHAIEPLQGAARGGAQLIGLWNSLVLLLALAYAYSFFWTAATGVYLLLRRDADAVELDEVLVEGQDDPASLPAVRTDAAGVSVLADEASEPPASSGSPDEPA